MKRMNNLMKKLAVWVVMAAVLLGSGIVTDTLTGNVIRAEAATMKLNKKSAELVPGETITLKVKNAGKKKVTWKSSNKKVATVNSKGKVTAKDKPGKSCTITATVGKKSFKCKISVVESKFYKRYMVWNANFTFTGTTIDGETVKGASPEWIDVIKKKDGYYFIIIEGHNYNVTDYYVEDDTENYIGKKLPDCFTDPVIKVQKFEDESWSHPAVNLFLDVDNNWVYEKARDYTEEEWRARMIELGFTYED